MDIARHIDTLCELNHPLRPAHLGSGHFPGERGGCVITTAVTRDGSPLTLNGCTAAGYVLRADGTTLVCAAECAGSAVSLALPQEAWAVPGAFQVLIRLTCGSTISTVFWGEGAAQAGGGSLMQAGEPVPTLDNLLNRIADMEAAAASARAVVTQFAALQTELAAADARLRQDLTAETQARENGDAELALADAAEAQARADGDAELALLIGQALTATPTVNLYDAAARLPDTTLGASGSTAANTRYDVSPMIPVTPGVRYLARHWSGSAFGTAAVNSTTWVVWGLEGGSLTRLGSGSGLSGGFTAPESAAFLRFAIDKSKVTGYNPAETMVVAREDSFPDGFVPFGLDCAFDPRIDNAALTAVREADSEEALRQAIADGCGLISLTADITLSARLIIPAECCFTLDGRGHILDAHGLSNAICVRGHAALRRLTVQNAANHLLIVGQNATEDGSTAAYSGTLQAEDCVFRRATDSLLVAVNSSVMTLNRCEIYGALAPAASGRVISSDGVSGKDDSRLHVLRCRIHDCVDEGVSTHDRSWAEVRDCEVYRCGYAVDAQTLTAAMDEKGAPSCFGGIHLGGAGMGEVIGCHSHDNATWGIGLYHFNGGNRTDVTVCRDNTVRRCGFVNGQPGEEGGTGGILCGFCNDLTLVHNTVTGCAGPGIRFGEDVTWHLPEPASRGLAAGNILQGNGCDRAQADGVMEGLVILP